MSSLFGFMSSSSSTAEDSPAAPAPAPAPAVEEEDGASSPAPADTANAAPAPSSGFGFMSPGSSTPAAESAASSVTNTPVAPPAPAPAPKPEVKAVVFDRSAATGVDKKVVKKKKKNTLVGRGREDEAEQPSASTTLSPSASLASISAASASTAATEETNAPDFKPESFNSPSASPENLPADDTTDTAAAVSMDEDGIPAPPKAVLSAPSTPKSSPPPVPTEAIAVPNRSSTTGLAARSPMDITADSNKPMQRATSVSASASVVFQEKNDKLHAYTNSRLNEFVSQASSASTEIGLLTLRQKNLKIQVAAAEKVIDTTRAEIVASEREQERLAEAEDFENAHAMSDTIENLTIRRKGAEGLIDTVKIESAEITTQLMELKDSVSPIIGGLLGTLRDMGLEQTDELKRFEKEIVQQNREESDRIETESARLALKQTKHTRDQERLQEEAAVVEEEIAKELGDVQERADSLQVRRFGLETEIAELEKQLAAKRSEEKEIISEGNDLDRQISTVRASFDRQLQILDERKTKIEHTGIECTKDAADIAQDEELLKSEEEQASSLRASSTAWCELLNNELEILRKVQNTDLHGPSLHSSSSSSSSSSNAKTEGQSQSSLQEELCEASAALGAASSIQQIKQDKLTVLETEVRDIDDKIPKIELEKKGYAGARKFKEAAAAAKEQQSLQARKDELAESVAAYATELEACALEVQACTDRKEAALQKLQAVQREEDMNRYQSLYKQEKYLLQVKESIIAIQDVENAPYAMLTKGPATALIGATLEGVQHEMSAIHQVHSLTDADVTVLVADDVSDGNSDNTSGTDDADDDTDNPGPAASSSEESTSLADESNEDAPGNTSTSEGTAGMKNEDEDKDEDNDADADEGAVKKARIEAARLLAIEVDAIASQIDEAAAAEDFDRAASLDDAMAREDGKLQALLASLSMTLDDVNA